MLNPSGLRAGLLAQNAGGAGPQVGAPQQDTDQVTITIKPFKRGDWPDGIPPRIESTTEAEVTGLRPDVDWFVLEIDNNDNDKKSGTATIVSPPPPPGADKPRITKDGVTYITVVGKDQTEVERETPRIGAHRLKTGDHRLRIKASLITNNSPSKRKLRPGPGSTEEQRNGSVYYQYVKKLGSGFTVCAHARDFRVRGPDGGDIVTLINQPGDGRIGRVGKTYFGIWVIMEASSDSGNPVDLARVPSLVGRVLRRSEKFSPTEIGNLEKMYVLRDGSFGYIERVALARATGPFAEVEAQTQKEYADACPTYSTGTGRLSSWMWDHHWYPWQEFTKMNMPGELLWVQKFWGQCRRCGGIDIDLEGSGFVVRFMALDDRRVRLEHGEAIPSGEGPIVEVDKFGAHVLDATGGTGHEVSKPIKVPNEIAK